MPARISAFFRTVLLALLLAPAGRPALADTDTGSCRDAAAPACWSSFPLPGGGTLRYLASLPEGDGPARAVVALHGHPRDAVRSFEATLRAARGAGALDHTLVVAPLFQVVDAGRCDAPGTPPAVEGELLWTCSSWIDGGRAANFGRPGSFAALDALVAELARRWPRLDGITLAGFSAGGQMVQHYIGFARPAAGRPLALRYVVADPGSWLYFDDWRPQPVDAQACPEVDRWKYGTRDLPAWLGRDAAQARSHYAAADIHYLEGELDSADRPGAYARILDKSCAAQAQGSFRLQRGQAYAAYHRSLLAPQRPAPLTVVPGCAHDVACVFPSDAARAALFGPVR